MDPIRDRIKNIVPRSFLGLTHKGKTQYIIMTYGYPLPPPRYKKICNSVRPHVFFTGDLSFYVIVIGK